MSTYEKGERVRIKFEAVGEVVEVCQGFLIVEYDDPDGATIVKCFKTDSRKLEKIDGEDR